MQKNTLFAAGGALALAALLAPLAFGQTTDGSAGSSGGGSTAPAVQQAAPAPVAPAPMPSSTTSGGAPMPVPFVMPPDSAGGGGGFGQPMPYPKQPSGQYQYMDGRSTGSYPMPADGGKQYPQPPMMGQNEQGRPSGMQGAPYGAPGYPMGGSGGQAGPQDGRSGSPMPYGAPGGQVQRGQDGQNVQMMQNQGGFGGGGQEGSQGMPWFGGGENSVDEGQIRQMMEDQQRKEAEERGLRDMKRGAQMMSREVTRVEQRLAALKKRKAPVSAEVEETMQRMKALVAQVTNAQTFDEMQEIDMGEFGEFMQIVNEGMQKAEMALQFPRVSKEANREISRLLTAVKRAESRAKKLKIDVSALLAEWRAEVNTLVQVRDAAQKLFSSGETEEAIELLHDEVFGRLEDAHEKERVFQMVSDIQQMLKGVDKEIKSFEKTIARLKKEGKNVARLEELLAQGKARIADIRALSSRTPVNADALIETIEAADTVKQDFMEELAAVTGKPLPATGQVPGLQGFKPMETPKEFEMLMNKGEGGIQLPQGGPTAPAKELQGGVLPALQRMSDRVGEFLLGAFGF